jgi:thymidylate synthase
MRNTIDEKYQDLLVDIIENGVDKGDRTGTGTRSVFGRQLRHDMREGFPLLTTKKMAWKTMVTELAWFLKGDTNIKFLVDHGCNIWNGDAYKYYLWRMRIVKIEEGEENVHILSQKEFVEKIKEDAEFAKEYGELGPIYGHQWRKWGADSPLDDPLGLEREEHEGVDQIRELVEKLKSRPDDRRLMVSAWNVGHLGKMWLPPCHYGFQVWTRELGLDERIDHHNKSVVPGQRSSDYFHEHLDDMGVPRRAISLMWNQRSVDTFLGLPFNISSYALLLEILAKEVNMVAEELVANLGDVHLYSNHMDQAREQILREAYKLPRIELSNECGIDNFEATNVKLIGYESHPTIKAPLSN